MGQTGILITAAGRGERFIQAGGEGNKLNAVLGGNGEETVFARTLRQALDSGLPVHVVTRPDNTAVLQLCRALQIPLTLLASHGLGDSIAAGVSATRHWQGWLIHLADMPFVTPEVFRQVATALREHEIVRPQYGDLPGHPVGFAMSMRAGLMALTGDQGARSLLEDNEVCQLAINDAAVVCDIDLPAHLAGRRSNEA
ncbi:MULTISPECIES: NTP transferase domain-containing protein [unclassified Paludibacterium]|uniref:nucleotidyltransferase family protein n=1 Tax=unclassified Paludibacterium TaxID=2618429 RepID=UPI001C03C5B4|nr:nucleotidyltransferase family protein [Paludibacterium sp. B53371]BEV71565.1 nucleotidyltransferase family protein [Paludibacterium sp. THUN1379]